MTVVAILMATTVLSVLTIAPRRLSPLPPRR